MLLYIYKYVYTKNHTMKYYALKTKTGEVINKIKAVDKDQAVELFAEIKQLSREDLLNIYLVDIFID